MNLSQNTLTVLKNLASINVNMLFEKGSNVLCSVSDRKTVLCRAEIDETFDVDFGIYDMNGFLGAVSLFNDPEIKFEPTFCTIYEKGDKRKRLKYYAADQSTLLLPPTKTIEIAPADIIANFRLTSESLKNITRAASLMQLNSIVIGVDGEKASIGAETKSTGNEVSNTFSVDITDTIQRGEAFDESHVVHIDKLNLNPISGIDYDVTVTKKAVRFASVQGAEPSIVYWYAPMTNS